MHLLQRQGRLGAQPEVPEHHLAIDSNAAKNVSTVGFEHQIFDALRVTLELHVRLEEAVLASLRLWFVQVVGDVFLHTLLSLALLRLLLVLRARAVFVVEVSQLILESVGSLLISAILKGCHNIIGFLMGRLVIGFWRFQNLALFLLFFLFTIGVVAADLIPRIRFRRRIHFAVLPSGYLRRPRGYWPCGLLAGSSGHAVDGCGGGELAYPCLRLQEAALVNRWKPAVPASILFTRRCFETLLHADVALYVPDDHAAVSATTGKYRRGRVTPCESIGRRSIMAEENHVGLTRLCFVLVGRRLLKVDVPNVYFGKVGVRGDYATVPRPALEAVNLSWMDENLAHLQSCLVALEALLASQTISFEGHPSVRKSAARPWATELREHVPLLRDVDLGDDEERRLSASPLLILVPVVDAAFVRPRAEVYLLAEALGLVQRFRTVSFLGSHGE